MSTFGEDLIQSLNDALAHTKGEGPAIVHAPAEHRLLEKWIYEGLSDEERDRIPPELLDRLRAHFCELADAALEEVGDGGVVDGPAIQRLRERIEAVARRHLLGLALLPLLGCMDAAAPVVDTIGGTVEEAEVTDPGGGLTFTPVVCPMEWGAAPDARTRLVVTVDEWNGVDGPLAKCPGEAVEAAVSFWEARIGETELLPSESCGVQENTVEIKLLAGPYHAAASVDCWDGSGVPDIVLPPSLYINGDTANPAPTAPALMPRRATVYLGLAFGDIYVGTPQADSAVYVRYLEGVYAVMKHELGHALGVTDQGGNWNRFSKVRCSHLATDCPSFMQGSCRGYVSGRVLAAYRRAGGRAPVVAMQSGFPAGHWSPSALRGELMSASPWTGPAGVRAPVSEITLASLADLGWTVDMALAEPYKVAAPDHCLG